MKLFLVLLSLMLIYLELTGAIAIGIFWALSPLWIPFLLSIIIIAVIYTFSSKK